MQQSAVSSNRLKTAILQSLSPLKAFPIFNQKNRFLLKITICFILYWLSILPMIASIDNHLASGIYAPACTAIDYNIVSNKQMIIISSDFGLSGGSFAAAIDGNAGANALWIQRYQDITNKTVFKFQFPTPTIVTGIEHTGGNGFLRGGAEYKIQGSNDNINWTDLTLGSGISNTLTYFQHFCFGFI